MNKIARDIDMCIEFFLWSFWLQRFRNIWLIFDICSMNYWIRKRKTWHLRNDCVACDGIISLLLLRPVKWIHCPHLQVQTCHRKTEFQNYSLQKKSTTLNHGKYSLFHENQKREEKLLVIEKLVKTTPHSWEICVCVFEFDELSDTCWLFHSI